MSAITQIFCLNYVCLVQSKYVLLNGRYSKFLNYFFKYFEFVVNFLQINVDENISLVNMNTGI